MLDVVFSNNGTLSEITPELSDVYSGTAVLPVVFNEDALYLGSPFPFNHFYTKLAVVNDQASVISIALWDGSSWNNVSRVSDETKTAGKTLAKSGYITFYPDINKSWAMDDTVDSSGAEQVTGLGSIKIYGRYWAKITFSASLKATTEASWLGCLYSNDSELGAEFPDLISSEIIAGFKTGKTDWFEQHVVAAEIIESDLVEMGAINDNAQILERSKLVRASVSKVAEIIFTGFGKDSLIDQQEARAEYGRRLKKSIVIPDVDENGLIDDDEIRYASRSGRLIR